jgi:hypothetical protein
MAEYSAPGTLTTPAHTITFNGASDIGQHDPDKCDGLDPQAPVRSVHDDRPRTSGGIVYPRLYGPRPIVLGGTVVATSLAVREGWLDDLGEALDSIMDGGGSYVWVTSVGTKTVTPVFCDVGLKSTGKWLKSYQFGLVCPNYAIT